MDKGLKRFVHDASSLRSQMGKYDALIDGSFAIQFFERLTWPDSDLDFFVEQGRGFESFCKYLVEAEGYQLVRTTQEDPHQYDYAMYDLMEVTAPALASSNGTSDGDSWARSELTPSRARIPLRSWHRRKPKSKSSLPETFPFKLFFEGFIQPL